MSRAERRLAAAELATRLRSQLETWQGCVARLANLDEQIDVWFSLLPNDKDVDLPSCVPLQCLLAKKVDYCTAARTLLSRLEESLDVTLSIQAEETHVEKKLRAKDIARGVKSKRKKSMTASSCSSSTIEVTSRDSDLDGSYSIAVDVVPDDCFECPSTSTMTDIDEAIASSTKTPLQLCALIEKCRYLLEAVILRKEVFLNLSEAFPKPSDRTGNMFRPMETGLCYEEEMLLHILDEYVKSLSSTKSKNQKDQQDESLNDESCNYTLDT